MVEAVTSSVSNASLVRATAEQANIARSSATAAAKAPQVVQAPFISPYIKVDNESNQVVLQIRNGETGKVIDQIPAKSSADENRTRETAPVVAQPQESPAQQAPTPSGSSASFGAFAKQVASLQSAVSGGGNGATVSLFA